MHSDLPQTVVYESVSFELQYYTDMLYGIVSEHDLDNDLTQNLGLASSLDNDLTQNLGLASSLHQAFGTSTQISDLMLFTVGRVTVAVIHRNGQYFLADSHARNNQGQPCSDGNAIVLHFADVQSLISYLNNCYNGAQFNLTPIGIEAS